MGRKIYVYGHREKDAFENSDDFVDYIERGVFEDNDRRYRYSQRKRTDVIVMSFAGTIYGHFETEPEVLHPTDDDLEQWDRSRGIYIVRKTLVYPKPLSLAIIGFTGIQFGKLITENQFTEILEQAGVATEVMQIQ